jgi:hypothetical protein
MRLLALAFTAMLVTAPVAAQQTPAPQDRTTDQATQDQATRNPAATDSEPTLPVSITKIREALETTPILSLSTVGDTPTFRVQIHERQRLDELLATLNFKAGPVPAGGVYMLEQNRIMFNPVDNPLRQPWSEFNQSQLLTLVIENLVRSYLSGKASGAISRAERSHAETVAKDEVRSAVAQYCSSQPNSGAGIQICDTPIR